MRPPGVWVSWEEGLCLGVSKKQENQIRFCKKRTFNGLDKKRLFNGLERHTSRAPVSIRTLTIQ